MGAISFPPVSRGEIALGDFKARGVHSRYIIIIGHSALNPSLWPSRSIDSTVAVLSGGASSAAMAADAASSLALHVCSRIFYIKALPAVHTRPHNLKLGSQFVLNEMVPRVEGGIYTVIA